MRIAAFGGVYGLFSVHAAGWSKITCSSTAEDTLTPCVTNMFVEAASSFSAATTKAGKVVPISGALAFRRSCLPALLSAAAMLSLPACRRRDLVGLLKRFEAAQDRLDETRGDDGDALEDMADLLSDIVQSGGGRDPDAGDGSAEGGDC